MHDTDRSKRRTGVRRILLAVDITAALDQAVRYAVDLASDRDALLHVLHVLPGQGEESMWQTRHDAYRAIHRGMLLRNQVTHVGERAGVQTRVAVHLGDPLAVILAELERDTCEVVIGGSASCDLVQRLLAASPARITPVDARS